MKNFNLNFYKNKKILITGHTGFKGSWLVQALLTVNAKIIGISFDSKQKKSIFYLNKLERKIIHYNFDLSSKPKELNKVLNKFKPSFIFNLAAQSLVRKSIEEPHKTIKNNIMINLNLLESLRSIKFKTNIIFITSDKVYENIEQQKGYREFDRLGGKDPYSASKSSSEIIISSYFRTFLKEKDNIKIGVARAGNVIGGGDWSQDRLIPDLVKNYFEKKLIFLRNPHSTRPWQHVLDPLFGYLIFAYKLHYNYKLNGEAINFGPNYKNNKNKTVLILAKEFKKYYRDLNYQISTKNLDKEAKLLSLNINKSNKLLDWEPVLGFSDSIKLTATWYKDYVLKKDMIKITNQQINDYKILCYKKLKN